MHRAILFSLLWVLGSIQTASAEEDAFKPQITPGRGRSIIVEGSSEVLVPPNKVTLLLSVKTFEKTLPAARAANQQAVKRVMEIFPKFKIEKNDLQTASVNVMPVSPMAQKILYPYNAQAKQLGYSFETTLSVILRDPGSTNALINSAIDAGANSVSDVTFDTTELTKYKDKARLEALRAARQKAEALTNEMGLKLGKPINITDEYNENLSGHYHHSAHLILQGASASFDSSGATGADLPTYYSAPVAIGLLSVKANVRTIFEMD